MLTKLNTYFKYNFHLRITLCIAAMITGMSVKAQDLHFSQFFEAPLVRNPALAACLKEM
ncbi:MAG: hypothetical protein QM768_01475 [Agriterribacter sp.]